MKTHLIDTLLLVPRSRSSAKVKVKYQGHISLRNGRGGGISVSQTHLVLLLHTQELTLYQMTNFRFFQIETVCRQQF